MVVIKIKNSEVIYHCLVFKNRTPNDITLQEANDYITNSDTMHRNDPLTTKDISVSSRIASEYGYDEVAMLSRPIHVYEAAKPRTLINNLTQSTYYPKLVKPKSGIHLESDTSHRIIIMKAKSQLLFNLFTKLSRNSYIFESTNFNFYTLGFILQAMNNNAD